MKTRSVIVPEYFIEVSEAGNGKESHIRLCMNNGKNITYLTLDINAAKHFRNNLNHCIGYAEL